MIRRATPQDAEAITAIWNPVIRDSTITFTTVQKTPEEIAQMIEARPVFVAAPAGQVAGFASFGPFRGGPGYTHVAEHTVMVAPGAHGQGIGRALIRAVMAEAKGRSIDILVAGISGDNAAAVEFHTALGFEIVGKMPGVGRKFGDVLDLVLMQKNI
ncbi:N-acetyltransferase family protein [Aliishimia ponticola]|uniref:N-acetyltransferase family protein n=1 Tax=Aliishimia ponticola TaxID=2499833 RepID=A0A4S4NAU4_9RHOB|nr:GNAT family N-acetyltransferase [Aliishimia ponticola]THH35795.1 N-acetyltransferase family protein [Aliishimia ponticola]